MLDSFSANFWLDEYIVEEVLESLPIGLRQFVLKTAGLPWLEAALCDEALDIRTSNEFMIELYRRQIFVRPSNAQTGSLRYHALFAESVERISKRELPAEELRGVLIRATQWLIRHGLHESAIELSLKAGDEETAVREAIALCRSLMDADYFESALFWLRRLPHTVVVANDELAYWTIRALFSSGSVHDGELMLAEVEQRWTDSEGQLQQGFAAASRALGVGLTGNFSEALKQCYLALHWLPRARIVDRFIMWTDVMIYAGVLGNDAVADEAYRQVEQCRRRLPSLQKRWMQNVEAERAIRYAVRGDLVTAEALLAHQLETASSDQRSFALRLHNMLAGIYLEWDQ
ncbi:MAG: hypothetical protein ACRDHN_15070, partial [Thermomicrobiales bacterium]